MNGSFPASRDGIDEDLIDTTTGIVGVRRQRTKEMDIESVRVSAAAQQFYCASKLT